jgi:UDP-N-acetyl-D-glucosamine dehydrogenase
MKTAIVGLGYVGLPLALQFARSGVSVLGLDIDGAKCARLNAGESYIKHVPGTEVAQARAGGLLEASTDFSRVGEADTIIICVPTPLNKYREPDMTHVFGTGESVAPHLRKGQLVVLESTTYPGTTDTDLRAILERGSGLVAGRDFHLAFSPEREDPGNPDSSVGRIPKVVGGLTPECLARASACYARAVERVVPVSSAAGEHFSFGEHRAGERVEGGVCGDGH